MFNEGGRPTTERRREVGVTVTFNVEAGRTSGFELNQGSNSVEHKGIQET